MTDRSTAYHEAGHAIAARVLAVRVRRVKLVRPPPKVGFVGLTYTAAAADILMNASTRIKLATLRIDAKIIAAGPAAEVALSRPFARRQAVVAQQLAC